MLLGGHIRDGHFTRVVYEWLRDETYEPAIAVLLEALQVDVVIDDFNLTRGCAGTPQVSSFSLIAGLLLLCTRAVRRSHTTVGREPHEDLSYLSTRYAQLMHICPGNLDYRINYAQCLFKVGHLYSSLSFAASFVIGRRC